ncbi:alkaline shock response membrane anchor protein AmaP [Dysgonomonas sp. 25]|uniref:alkaline shock response membrane anchor protein AmaP n=1 Tax=Dysgonomonas sp. 25 TaxID=2302933 RepID=UPI00210674F5|nr:alkaline shock response membrane anchor protein AmaP [Dysgonomonas sp. 25]
MRTFKKIIFTLLAILIIGGLIFGYIWYFVPFSDSGVKAGTLNNIKHKGIIFKTYEGELIQTGFGMNPKDRTLQSNEFQFSVANKEIAEKLMGMSGQVVKVHYKEYFGALPWRGYSKFVVDSILEPDHYQQPQYRFNQEGDSNPDETNIEDLPPVTGGEISNM